MIVDKKEGRKEAQRKEILTAAEQIFARQGFHLTTMEEVATACAWSKGTLYLHFKSKEDLFFSVIHEKLDMFSATLFPALKRSQSLEQSLAILIDAQFQFFIDNLDFFQLAISEQGKVLHESSSALRNSLIEKQQLHIKNTSQVLAKHLPADCVVKPGTLARSILGAIDTHTLTWLVSPSSIDINAIKLEIIHLFLNGVIPNK